MLRMLCYVLCVMNYATVVFLLLVISSFHFLISVIGLLYIPTALCCTPSRFRATRLLPTSLNNSYHYRLIAIITNSYQSVIIAVINNSY